MEQLAIDFARTERDVGMSRATGKADNDHDGWSAQALSYIHAYALTHDRFCGWMVVAASRLEKAVPEASGKAWGSLFVKAQRDGWIVKDGTSQDPQRHLNICHVYRSLIYRRAA